MQRINHKTHFFIEKEVLEYISCKEQKVIIKEARDSRNFR